jgi:hypothetical protein
MQTLRRNLATFMAAVLAYYVWWRIADAYALARRDALTFVDPLVLHALLDVVLGAAMYFAFATSWYSRVLLSAAIPVMAGILMQITGQSDPAYPTIALFLGAVMGALFLVGAVLGCGVDALRKARRGSVA